MPEMTLLDAIREALNFEMSCDPNVLVYGMDVAKNGGVFRATDGLLNTFGAKRVIDMPLAENTMSGLAVGMAMQGLKPVVEFQFSGFIYAGIDQITSEAARIRNRSRGRLHCPIVYRAPYGGGIHAPEHHSESPEAVLAHIPGIRVVIPSSPSHAYGLLLAAIRDPDPVVFLEPKRIYRAVKHDITNDGQALLLDKCFLLREGSDLTLISWGAMLKETMEAADILSQNNIETDVIDVATIKPLDIETIAQSVEKTGRCLIIHEAPQTCGFAAEIIAQLNEQVFYFLKIPVKRITGFDTFMPYYKLEKYYLPHVQDIVDTANAMMEF
jgi:2-oxoisovalerate dehydrogenase E1 component beta subunit